MDATLKAKWVEALRSGEFKQGTGTFQDGEHFCCLGVLCVVAGQPTTHDDGKCVDNWDYIYRALNDDNSNDGNRWPLIRLNDGGASFPEIADYIEKHL